MGFGFPNLLNVFGFSGTREDQLRYNGNGTACTGPVALVLTWGAIRCLHVGTNAIVPML